MSTDGPRIERDLLTALLDGATSGDPQHLLGRVLEVAARACRAQRGYLAVHDAGEAGRSPPRWWTSVGFESSSLETVRDALSRGVLDEALASRDVIVVNSALTDQRYAHRTSIQVNQIESVLAGRIDGPARAIVYLQGSDRGLFGAEDADLLRRLNAWLEPVVARVAASSVAPTDPTAPYRREGRFSDLVGRSRALAEVMRTASAFAGSEASVLLTGATGTGKSMLAKAIHAASPRAAGPFVAFNAAAMPESLVESELFGAEAGAHSTALTRSKGVVEQAAGGTLLLDEVGDLPLPAQAKLLLFVQQGTYKPLGGSAMRTADVRLIAATHVDLEAAVEEGRFRQDLLHRIDVLRLHLPSLASRPTDIPLLVDAIGRRVAPRNGRPWVGVDASALAYLQSREWPGNIRQLENLLERAVVMQERPGPITLEDLAPKEDDRWSEMVDGLGFDAATDAFQRRMLVEAREAAGGNVTLASERLQIRRARFYELAKRLGIDLDA